MRSGEGVTDASEKEMFLLFKGSTSACCATMMELRRCAGGEDLPGAIAAAERLAALLDDEVPEALASELMFAPGTAFSYADYNTLLADGGAYHIITDTLRINSDFRYR